MPLIIIKNKDDIIEEICECTYYSKATILRNYMNNFILEIKDTPEFEKIQIPQSDLCTTSTVIKWVKEYIGKTIIILDCPRRDIWYNVVKKQIKTEFEPDENGNVNANLVMAENKILSPTNSWFWDPLDNKAKNKNTIFLEELKKLKTEKIESGQKPFKPKKNPY